MFDAFEQFFTGERIPIGLPPDAQTIEIDFRRGRVLWPLDLQMKMMQIECLRTARGQVIQGVFRPHPAEEQTPQRPIGQFIQKMFVTWRKFVFDRRKQTFVLP